MLKLEMDEVEYAGLTQIVRRIACLFPQGYDVSSVSISFPGHTYVLTEVRICVLRLELQVSRYVGLKHAKRPFCVEDSISQTFQGMPEASAVLVTHTLRRSS